MKRYLIIDLQKSKLSNNLKWYVRKKSLSRFALALINPLNVSCYHFRQSHHIDAVSQRNWSLSIECRLEGFVAKSKQNAKVLSNLFICRRQNTRLLTVSLRNFLQTLQLQSCKLRPLSLYKICSCPKERGNKTISAQFVIVNSPYFVFVVKSIENVRRMHIYRERMIKNSK